MNAYEDAVFQAHCEIDNLYGALADGAKLESCDGHSVEVLLSDGSYMAINLGPILDLVAALKRLPKPVEDA